MARETPSPHPSWLMPLIILNPSLKLTTRTLSLRSPRTWRWKPLSKRETIMLQLTTYRYQRFYSTVPPSASSSWWNNVSFMNNWSQCFSVSYYEIYFEQSSSWAVWGVELLVCQAVPCQRLPCLDFTLFLSAPPFHDPDPVEPTEVDFLLPIP